MRLGPIVGGVDRYSTGLTDLETFRVSRACDRRVSLLFKPKQLSKPDHSTSSTTSLQQQQPSNSSSLHLQHSPIQPIIMKLTIEDKLRYIQGIAKTFWDVQEPQTAQSSNRGPPLHETLFSVSGLMSTYWVKGWLYEEEIEMSEQGIIKTLTAGMQELKTGVDVLFFRDTAWFTRQR